MRCVRVVYDSFRVDKVAVSNALTGDKRHAVTLVSAGSVCIIPCYTCYMRCCCDHIFKPNDFWIYVLSELTVLFTHAV